MVFYQYVQIFRKSVRGACYRYGKISNEISRNSCRNLTHQSQGRGRKSWTMLVYNKQYKFYYVWINSHLKTLNWKIVFMFEFQRDTFECIIEKRLLVKKFCLLLNISLICSFLLIFTNPSLVLSLIISLLDWYQQ